MILAYANKHDLEIFQLDIRVAFLNGFLKKPVYMITPQGLNVHPPVRCTHVYKLICSLYGLKISPKRWFERFRNFIHRLGFKPFVFQPCFFKWQFTKNGVTKQVILILYVDDILLIGDCNDKI